MRALLGRITFIGGAIEFVGLPALPTTGLNGGDISLSVASLFKDTLEIPANKVGNLKNEN